MNPESINRAGLIFWSMVIIFLVIVAINSCNPSCRQSAEQQAKTPATAIVNPPAPVPPPAPEVKVEQSIELPKEPAKPKTIQDDPEYQQQSEVGKIFYGEHKLETIARPNGEGEPVSFRFLVGPADEYSRHKVLVEFGWQLNDGSYLTCTLPREKFRRIIGDDSVVTSTIKFHWQVDCCSSTVDIQKLLDKDVDYVIVTMKPNEPWLVD